MKSYEICSRISPELMNSVLVFLLEHEKPVYKAIIQNIAARRKLRPVYIERKPKIERHLWIQRALSSKGSDDLAVQLLQIWLLGEYREMICDFLDLLGIKHDGKGVVDDLPPEPPREVLTQTITKLLEKYHREIVAVYLHAFQAMDETGWSTLGEVLSADPRVAL
jgi:hypothetical protein